MKNKIASELLKIAKGLVARDPLVVEIEDTIHPDQIVKKGPNKFLIRKGFYYSGGFTAEAYAEKVKKQFGDRVKILDKGEKWVAFKGGASVSNQSHWWVLFELSPSITASEPDHAKAVKMLKHSEYITKNLLHLASEVDKELKFAEKQIIGLEKVGSHHIEAPKLLKQVQAKVRILNSFVDGMTSEIKKALGEETN